MVSLVALVPLLLPLSVSAQSTCARNYTVHLGDICDTISATQNVSTFQLANTNPQINSDCSNLALGEPLCLGFVGSYCNTTHIVVSGDSCTSIAAAANVTYSTLLANNPNVDELCNNIYPNEVLCTATSVIPYNTNSTRSSA